MVHFHVYKVVYNENQTRKRRNLLELDGKIEFRHDYDYKASRENK